MYLFTLFLWEIHVGLLPRCPHSWELHPRLSVRWSHPHRTNRKLSFPPRNSNRMQESLLQSWPPGERPVPESVLWLLQQRVTSTLLFLYPLYLSQRMKCHLLKPQSRGSSGLTPHTCVTLLMWKALTGKELEKRGSEAGKAPRSHSMAGFCLH